MSKSKEEVFFGEPTELANSLVEVLKARGIRYIIVAEKRVENGFGAAIAHWVPLDEELSNESQLMSAMHCALLPHQMAVDGFLTKEQMEGIYSHLIMVMDLELKSMFALAGVDRELFMPPQEETEKKDAVN